jgi:hypothetical protein
VLGSTNYTDTQVEAAIYRGREGQFDGRLERGVIARWVSSSSYLRAAIVQEVVDGPGDSFLQQRTLRVTQRVSDVSTPLAETPLNQGVNDGQSLRIRLVVYDSGRFIAQLFSYDGLLIATAQGSSPDLATGGALDDGKPGLFDINTSSAAITRLYDEFRVSVPAPEPVVCHPGRSFTITGENVTREDATGTFSGRVPSYRGGQIRFPPGTNRFFVRAASEDLDVEAYQTTSIPISVQISYTPRGLVVPRT